MFPPRRKLVRATPLALLCALSLVGLAFSPVAQADSGCAPGMRCGTVTVPLDRTHPSSGTIDIAYAVVPRTDTSRPALGTIVTNPGGPGQATIASAFYWVKPLAPLRRRRDLLVIDARGTGQSGAIACPSLSGQDPLSLGKADLARLCGADLGPRAGLYGSAAVADDMDAVRAALHLDKLDLWGDSYGTFLMPVYAARHPEHVRSIVLDGAFPTTADPWGRDVLHGLRRVIGLVCRRSHRCSGARVLRRIGRLSQRLRHHPVTFMAHTPAGVVPLTAGERELADVTYGGGDPRVYGLLPAAVDAALHHDVAPLERLVTVSRIGEVTQQFIEPTSFSLGAGDATECHDYARPYDLADTPAHRRAQYRSGLSTLGAGAFSPFSAKAWLGTEIDAGPKCLDWPADPTAGSPLQGRALPDVPVLVQSGELDTDTPVEQGRLAAAQFAHPTIGVVANAGHTPDLSRCGVAMAIDFVQRLRTDADRCRHAGRPPVVVGRPALHAAQLPSPRIHAAAPVRRAVSVALATITDVREYAGYSGLTGAIDALRGGTYAVSPKGVRFAKARVVVDAVTDGTQRASGHAIVAQLRLHGAGIARSRLTLRIAGRRIRVVGTVGHRHVAVAGSLA